MTLDEVHRGVAVGQESSDCGKLAADAQSVHHIAKFTHSAVAWGHRLVIFGGMGQDMKYDVKQRRVRPPTPEGLEGGPDPSLSVLSDVLVYDTIEGTWTAPEVRLRERMEPPLARYAHLCTITNGCLVVLVRNADAHSFAVCRALCLGRSDCI